ncbi:hypothetical protein C1701_26940 [Actinoalloteichus sp. AHMU CJ021]|nr:hypothetical protein C1701_26940 [Actinoalloteichus sp. AHMU CJ021]
MGPVAVVVDPEGVFVGGGDGARGVQWPWSSTQKGCSSVAVTVPGSWSGFGVWLTSTRVLGPSLVIVATTRWGPISPVSGSEARTSSPSWMSSMGVRVPSARRTRVPGTKLLTRQPALRRTAVASSRSRRQVRTRSTARLMPRRRSGILPSFVQGTALIRTQPQATMSALVKQFLMSSRPRTSDRTFPPASRTTSMTERVSRPSPPGTTSGPAAAGRGGGRRDVRVASAHAGSSPGSRPCSASRG